MPAKRRSETRWTRIRVRVWSDIDLPVRKQSSSCDGSGLPACLPTADQRHKEQVGDMLDNHMLDKGSHCHCCNCKISVLQQLVHLSTSPGCQHTCVGMMFMHGVAFMEFHS